MLKEIIGHAPVLDFFDKVIAAGNLSHAYCLVGPDKAGKRTVAEHLSAKIFGVEPEKLKLQPDLMFVRQEMDEKTAKTKKNIDVDQIRDLCLFLSRRSFLDGYKIAIIDEAEKMNVNSSNVLLKTLEEPKGKTILFLIAKDEMTLPRTIKSRCQTIYFHPVAKNLIKDFIVSRGVEEKQADEMARLSAGLPGRVCDWLENARGYEDYKKEILKFVSLFNKPFHDKLNKVNDLFGDKTDHIAARENLQDIMDIWLNVLRAFLHSNNGLAENKAKIKLDNKKLIKISNLIQEAKDFLSANIHPRLLVERILLEMP